MISSFFTKTKPVFLLMLSYFIALVVGAQIVSLWMTNKKDLGDYAIAGFIDVLLVIVLYWVTKRKILGEASSELIPSLWQLSRYATFSLILLAIPTGLLNLLGYYTIVEFRTWHLVPVVALALLCQGISAEVLFRGVLFENLKRWLGPIKSTLVLSSVYAALNLLIDGPSPQAFLTHWLICSLLCLIYLHTRNLWVVGIFHGVWLISAFIPGVLDEHWRDGAPWLTQIVGNSIVSGGPLGAEASLFSLLLLIIANIYYLRLLTKSSLPEH